MLLQPALPVWAACTGKHCQQLDGVLSVVAQLPLALHNAQLFHVHA